MTAPPKYFDAYPIHCLLEQDIVAIRQWERFKWLARGLAEVADHYEVSRLEDLFTAPPTMPGQREKVVVLLAMKASPQARLVLKDLDTSGCGESFRHLHQVALRYATRQSNH